MILNLDFSNKYIIYSLFPFDIKKIYYIFKQQNQIFIHKKTKKKSGISTTPIFYKQKIKFYSYVFDEILLIMFDTLKYISKQLYHNIYQ